MMNRVLLPTLSLLVSVAHAYAEPIDVLRGKATFNWLSDPAKQKCVIIAEQLFAELKSSRYRCELEPKYSVDFNGYYRVCTSVPRAKEYLIFDQLKVCESERKEQAANP